MTVSCTEVVERKFAICIEIWQVELEDGVWRASFHKYAYVHGDPVNAIDPTGWFSSTQVVVTVGIGASSMSQGASSILALLFLYSTIGPSVESLQELMAIQELAQKLKTEVVRKTDIEEKLRRSRNQLFVHGTTTKRWKDALGFDLKEPVGGWRRMDFGAGFYTRKFDPQGFKDSSSWAIDVANFENSIIAKDMASEMMGNGDPFPDDFSWTRSYPIVFIVGVDTREFANMTSVNYGTPMAPVQPAYDTDVNAYRRGEKQFAGTDYVVGPTAKRSGGVWKVDASLSNQYKFEPRAFPKLKLLGIAPADVGFRQA
jgi:hypothetical protein